MKANPPSVRGYSLQHKSRAMIVSGRRKNGIKALKAIGLIHANR